MERERVSSSNIASVGYEPGSNLLEVEFLNGSIYQYRDVPKNVYEDFMASRSLGSYLNSRIRGKYLSHQIA